MLERIMTILAMILSSLMIMIGVLMLFAAGMDILRFMLAVTCIFGGVCFICIGVDELKI